MVKYADSGASLLQWQLQFQDLADTEIAILQDFFADCEGQLNGFTLADPLGNLLVWSEAINEPAWQASSLLEIAAGIADPNGGTAATQITNPTGADLTVQQTVNSPGWFCYCFSVYVQNPGASVSLFMQAGTSSDALAFPAQASWERISLSAQMGTTAAAVTAGITIPAGQSASVFGFQLEPQPAASPYKPSFSAGGVYANAHFGSDTFAVTTSAPNRNQCTLIITTS